MKKLISILLLLTLLPGLLAGCKANETSGPEQPEATEAATEPQNSDAQETDPTDDAGLYNPAQPETSGEYFVKIGQNAVDYYYTDRVSEIRFTGGNVVCKDCATGAEETLFSTDFPAEAYAYLVGVTENRLYFGWNTEEDWWGLHVYSVAWDGSDRLDYGDGWSVDSDDGWIVLRSFHSDVRQETVRVIGQNDEPVARIEGVWDIAAVDGILYYVWGETDWEDKAASMPEEEYEALIENWPFYVCSIDRDGKIHQLGTLYGHAMNSFFGIDAENREILNQNGTSPADCERWDLLTLEKRN